jgi:VWFA-related protein
MWAGVDETLSLLLLLARPVEWARIIGIDARRKPVRGCESRCVERSFGNGYHVWSRPEWKRHRVMRAFALGTIISMAIAPPTAQAQQSDEGTAQEPRSHTLQATSRLVQLNVLVHDAKGKPVRGLTKGDFVVLDEGRQRRVAIFRIAEERATPVAAIASHPLSVTNRGLAQAERPAAATILLVDSLNMRSTDDLLYTKRELPKFLKNLHTGDPVAVYNLAGPTVRVIHEFSDNTESLIRSAERGSSVVSQLLRGEPAGMRIRVEWTLAAMEAIAMHLADIPGRKTLVWISSAFPITLGFAHMENLAGGASTANAKAGDLESYHDRLKRLARILNSIDLAIYPVDPRGLMIDDRYKATARSGDVSASRLQSAGENSLGEFATMDLIASETGGRAYYNANALGDSIQRAVDDARVTYVLGFYPDEASWNGRNHRLEVRVNRPGVEVRSRRSYFASDAHVESQPEREAALKAAAVTALNGTVIGVTVNVASNPLRPGAQQIEVTVDPQDVHFESKNGKWQADFDLVLTQQAPDGRRLAGERNQCLVDRETYAESQSKGLSFRRDIAIQQEAASLRVLIRDSANGAVGSLSVPVGQARKPKGKTE